MSGLDSNTKLLLRAELYNQSSLVTGSKEIIDYSGRHVITQNGTTQLIPRHHPSISTTAGYFASSDYIYLADHDDWDMFSSTTTNRSIDCWVYVTADYAATGYYTLGGNWGNYYDGFFFGIGGTTSGKYLRLMNYQGSGYVDIVSSSADTIKSGRWHHVAGIKVGTAVGIYIDGTQVGYFTQNYTGTASNTFLIGGSRNSTGSISSMPSPMWIRDLRYTSDNHFSASPNSSNTDTITVPTTSPSTTTNTLLLITFDGDAPTDASSNHTVVQGDSSIVAGVAPGKFGSSGCWFDGDSDYLSTPDSSDWDITVSNSDNWTIDFWMCPNSVTGDHDLISQFNSSSVGWHVKFEGTNRNIRYQVYNSGNVVDLITSASPITFGKWHHIAVVKQGSTYGIYINGTQKAYSYDTDTLSSSSEPLIIGKFGSNSNWYYTGYLDEIRISKSNIFNASPNSSKTDTITVPTSQATPDSNTKLLLRCDTQDLSYYGGNY